MGTIKHELPLTNCDLHVILSPQDDFYLENRPPGQVNTFPLTEKMI